MLRMHHNANYVGRYMYVSSYLLCTDAVALSVAYMQKYVPSI